MRAILATMGGLVFRFIMYTPFMFVCYLDEGDLELDPRNYRKLCETEANRPAPNHHLVLGHEDDFQVNNEDVVTDITRYKGMDGKLILAEATFAQKVTNRPKPFPQWSAKERVDYRAMLDATLPPDPILCKRYGIVITPYKG